MAINKTVKIIFSDSSEQALIHWPNGQVTFEDLSSFTRLLSFFWWCIKLQWNGHKEGYRVELEHNEIKD